MKRVIFDIGHGVDTYPPSKGVGDFAEHTFNSTVAMKAKELAEYNGIEVVLTQQPFQKEVGLKTRSAFVNHEHQKNKFDCLVSFHANASRNTSADGHGVLYWHTSSKGKRLADIWNKYANDLPNERWGSGLFQSRPNHWTNMHILRETNPPAILLEFFFFTNPKELEVFTTEEVMNKCAEVTVKAVCEYVGVEFNPIPEPVKEKPVEEWKLNPLKELHEAGFVQDIGEWSKKVDESAPNWLVFLLVNMLRKEIDQTQGNMFAELVKRLKG